MLGIVISSDKSSRLYRDTQADFPLVKLELCKTRCAKRWIKKLAKCGVSRVVVSDRMSCALKPMLEKYGITPVTGGELLPRLGARIALSALCCNNICIANTGAEIYSGSSYAYEAVSVCSKEMRYVSVCGRGSAILAERASEELGISVISGEIPAGLCENILRLYLDVNGPLFSIITKSQVLKFQGANIVLPQKYSVLCDAENELGLAQALVQSGKLMISQIGIRDVRLSNC